MVFVVPRKTHKRIDAGNDYRVITEFYLFPKEKENIDKIMKTMER
jgi:hypothetical protein